MSSITLIFHLFPEAGLGRYISTNSFVQKRASLYLAIGRSDARLPRPVTSNTLQPHYSKYNLWVLVTFPIRSMTFPKILNSLSTVDTRKPVWQCAKKAIKCQLTVDTWHVDLSKCLMCEPSHKFARFLLQSKSNSVGIVFLNQIHWRSENSQSKELVTSQTILMSPERAKLVNGEVS